MNIVIDYNHQTYSLDVPDNVPIQAVSPAIARKLELPETELDGSVYLYYFAYDGALLEPSQTFAQLNVENGAVLDFWQEQVTPQTADLVTTAPNPDPVISIQIAPLTREQSRQRTLRRVRRYASIGYLADGMQGLIFLAVFACAFITMLSLTTGNRQSRDTNPTIVTRLREAENIAPIPYTNVSRLHFRNPLDNMQFNPIDTVYSPFTDEVIVAQSIDIIGMNIETQEIHHIERFRFQITHLLLSGNGRYLVARLNNSSLYWQDLETGDSETITPPDYEPIKDIDVLDDGKIVLIHDDTNQYISYSPLNDTRFVAPIHTTSFEPSPHLPLMYNLNHDNSVNPVMQKFDTSNETVLLQYEKPSKGLHPFCSPFWIGNQSKLLVTNCSEAAFHVSKNQDVDLAVAFNLPDVRDILFFADTPDALFFLLKDNQNEVLVWPLDKQEPYTVPVAFGNGRYIFTDYNANTNTTQLIILGQDHIPEHYIQVTELTK